MTSELSLREWEGGRERERLGRVEDQEEDKGEDQDWGVERILPHSEKSTKIYQVLTHLPLPGGFVETTHIQFDLSLNTVGLMLNFKDDRLRISSLYQELQSAFFFTTFLGTQLRQCPAGRSVHDIYRRPWLPVQPLLPKRVPDEEEQSCE